jgi:hypothetical protein
MNARTLVVERKNWLMVAVAAVMALAMLLSAQSVLAAGHDTFEVSVYHGINGNSLGLSKDLPVNIWIMKDNGTGLALFAKVNDFTFKERFEAELPAGKYQIMVESVELGAVIDSMTVGPVDIPEDADLRIHAKLGAGKNPVLSVRAR